LYKTNETRRKFEKYNNIALRDIIIQSSDIIA